MGYLDFGPHGPTWIRLANKTERLIKEADLRSARRIIEALRQTSAVDREPTQYDWQQYCRWLRKNRRRLDRIAQKMAGALLRQAQPLMKEKA